MIKLGFASALISLLSCGTTATLDRPAVLPSRGEPTGCVTPEALVLKMPEPPVEAAPTATLLERFPTLLVQPKLDAEYFIVKVAPDPTIDYRMPVIGQEDDTWGEVEPQGPQPGGQNLPNQ